MKSNSKFKYLSYTLYIFLDLRPLDKLKKASSNFLVWQLWEIGIYDLAPYFLIWYMEGTRGIWFSTTFPYMVIAGTRGIWFSTAFPYMVIAGTRGIWFSTTFPYMVIAGTRGIWFSTITRYCRCRFIIRACSLPFFYLIEPMCIVRMGSYSYI